jgi:alcohol dehydrogenase
MATSFRALVADKSGEQVAVSLREWSPDQLMGGEVTIRVAYSSVNYKDALAACAAAVSEQSWRGYD